MAVRWKTGFIQIGSSIPATACLMAVITSLIQSQHQRWATIRVTESAFRAGEFLGILAGINAFEQTSYAGLGSLGVHSSWTPKAMDMAKLPPNTAKPPLSQQKARAKPTTATPNIFCKQNILRPPHTETWSTRVDAGIDNDVWLPAATSIDEVWSVVIRKGGQYLVEISEGMLIRSGGNGAAWSRREGGIHQDGVREES
ncbi:hypothetical protein DFH07DRAFT_766414 [Mycena maculata]|uniref:Uncharacterized protein n=1 Tax=Mycena maculata TaxID=230809 RepID=A0AAD7NWC8_9AGAR|nr:hypothetical protein DFH07DRAFT_766414 [Mycena maculata]